ncbi:MAG: His-Xaa-Ser system radical SAM maturase HxsB [Sedimentisphaerales bacterium]
MNATKPYQLFPFEFMRLNNNKRLVVNEVGEHVFLAEEDFQKLINHTLDHRSSTFFDLKAKHILTDTAIAPVIDMLAIKYRTKKAFLYNFTSLHMVVPTLRCNSNCIYCQVSKKNPDAIGFDMDKRTVENTVKMIFSSPSPAIKIEFQGGEPLLNFRIVKYIVKYAEKLNKIHGKHLTFVICTNLTLVTHEILKFLKRHNISISTSLDGPCELHNKNRPLQSNELSYDRLISNIKLARGILGPGSVSALMTTTRYSLDQMKEIVDEYVRMGFQYIFIRSLNPYGGAKRESDTMSYNMDEFVKKYKDTLNYIIELNLRGTYLIESFSSLLLKRILTPFSTGFVDLQSPAGTGIEGAVYDYNGNVYVSDEGRMLAAMGDPKFLIGNVNSNSHKEIFAGSKLKDLIANSCIECLPICCHCAFRPYCGADPVRNYAEYGDILCYASLSQTCKKCKGILLYLFELLQSEDKNLNRIFWSWINRKPLQELPNCEAC